MRTEMRNSTPSGFKGSNTCFLWYLSLHCACVFVCVCHLVSELHLAHQTLLANLWVSEKLTAALPVCPDKVRKTSASVMSQRV